MLRVIILAFKSPSKYHKTLIRPKKAIHYKYYFSYGKNNDTNYAKFSQAVVKLASKVINHLNAINLCSVKGGTDIAVFKGSFD